MKEKNKQKLVILAGILITIGILLIAIPFIAKQRLKNHTSTKLLDQVASSEIAKNSKVPTLKDNMGNFYDFSNIQDISATNTFLNISEIDKSKILGQLVIKDVDMNVMILKEPTNENLLAGVTTIKRTDKMGFGNYTLAGHYNKDKSILFGALMDVKIGQKIKVTDKENIYEYTVFETKQVGDKATYVLSDKLADIRQKPVITLITCYYSSKTGKRYIVHGELNKVYKYSESRMNT